MTEQEKQHKLETAQKKLAEVQKELDELKCAKIELCKWEPKGSHYVNNIGMTQQSDSENIKNTLYHEFGNVFPTLEAVKKAVKQMRVHNRLLAYVAEFDCGWEADWNNKKQFKCYVYTRDSKWYLSWNKVNCYPGIVYMSENCAEKLIIKLNSGEVEL